MANDFTDVARDSWEQLHPDQDLVAFSVGMRLRRLASISHQQRTETVQTFGFAVYGDYEIAASLRRTGGPMRPSDLATNLMLTQAGVTGRLNRLETTKTITRHQLEQDGRGILVTLTNAVNAKSTKRSNNSNTSTPNS